jgi:hypothetical protein
MQSSARQESSSLDGPDEEDSGGPADESVPAMDELKPREERPFTDFFPDLSADQPLSVLWSPHAVSELRLVSSLIPDSHQQMSEHVAGDPLATEETVSAPASSFLDSLKSIVSDFVDRLQHDASISTLNTVQVDEDQVSDDDAKARGPHDDRDTKLIGPDDGLDGQMVNPDEEPAILTNISDDDPISASPRSQRQDLDSETLIKKQSDIVSSKSEPGSSIDHRIVDEPVQDEPILSAFDSIKDCFPRDDTTQSHTPVGRATRIEQKSLGCPIYVHRLMLTV